MSTFHRNVRVFFGVFALPSSHRYNSHFFWIRRQLLLSVSYYCVKLFDRSIFSVLKTPIAHTRGGRFSRIFNKTYFSILNAQVSLFDQLLLYFFLTKYTPNQLYEIVVLVNGQPRNFEIPAFRCSNVECDYFPFFSVLLNITEDKNKNSSRIIFFREFAVRNLRHAFDKYTVRFIHVLHFVYNNSLSTFLWIFFFAFVETLRAPSPFALKRFMDFSKIQT